MKKLAFTAFCILAIFNIFCGGSSKTVTPEPEKPPPPRIRYIDYFNSGKLAFESGKLNEAVDSFKKCVEVNPNFAPAMEYLGYSYLDLNKYEDAFNEFSKALDKDAYLIRARIGLGRVYLSNKDYDQAIREFDVVIKQEHKNGEAHFYRGVSLKETQKEFRSNLSFIRTIMNDESYNSTVAELIDLTNPDISKLFRDEFLNVEDKPRINRGELAALIATVIEKKWIFESGSSGEYSAGQDNQYPVINDVDSEHWAADEIAALVRSGIMQLNFDGSFRPERHAVKADFASILQIIVIKSLRRPELETAFLGQTSPFSDLNSSHWAYNACRISAEYNLLENRNQDIFGIGDSVSGITAITALERVNSIK